jgi:hypothetical protein
MRKKLLAIGLTLGLVFVLAGPALASSGRPSINKCVGNYPYTTCRSLRGVAADLYLDDLTMGCPGGHVSSVYMSRYQDDPFSDYVEFGWTQDRYSWCEHTDKTFFIAVKYPGQAQYLLWQKTMNSPNDWYRFTIRQYVAGKFEFYYNNLGDPAGDIFATNVEGGHVIYYPQTGWSTGYAHTSEEFYAMDGNGNCLDYPTPATQNVWNEFSSLGWYPTNAANSSALHNKYDGCADWSGNIVSGSGLTGDKVNYVAQ